MHGMTWKPQYSNEKARTVFTTRIKIVETNRIPEKFLRSTHTSFLPPLNLEPVCVWGCGLHLSAFCCPCWSFSAFCCPCCCWSLFALVSGRLRWRVAAQGTVSWRTLGKSDWRVHPFAARDEADANARAGAGIMCSQSKGGGHNFLPSLSYRRLQRLSCSHTFHLWNS